MFIFGDEAGNFDFRIAHGATRYFMVTTVAVPKCDFDGPLMELRRKLLIQGEDISEEFSASEDSVAVRKAVFDLIKTLPLRVDCTLLEKSKAQPHTRVTDERFYQYAWWYHLKYVLPRAVPKSDTAELLVASIGTRKKQRAFQLAVHDVAAQLRASRHISTAHARSSSDPMLQVADYCSWALFRKWERGDQAYHQQIEHLIHTECDLWAAGSKHYYGPPSSPGR